MNTEQPVSTDAPCLRARFRRFAPLAVVALGMLAVFATGAHRHVSLETLVRHRMAIDAFIDAHEVAAVAAFMAVYIAVVALSIPGAIFLTISGGILFGTLVGGLAAVVSATAGATIIFLVAKGACGENLARRAGPLAGKLADGFRADAFSYLLFLRLVPAFPFFLVNLAPALVGVKLKTFVAATAIGIVPATFAFAYLGAGFASTIALKEAAFKACLAGGGTDCAVGLDSLSVTPELVASVVIVVLIAVVPVAVKRWRARAAHPAAVAAKR